MKQLFSTLGTGKQQSFLEKNALREHILLLLAIRPQPLVPHLCLTNKKVFVVGQVVAEFSLYNLFQEQKQGRTFRNRKDVWSFFSPEAGYKG